jgi:hypothetical protein
MKNNDNIFGKLLIEKLRDVSIESCHGLLEGKYSSPSHKSIQKELEGFSDEQKKVILNLVKYCVDGGMNDFLYNLDEKIRKDNSITIIENGYNIIEDSPGLNRELHGDKGWILKFSKFLN